MLATGATSPTIVSRLAATRAGKKPWIATLTPAELQIVRSHGIRPIAAISATCWLFYRSWTLGHRDGWTTALARLCSEAAAGGANAVLDVKMRTIPSNVRDSMDFTLTGTAVAIEGLDVAATPVVATVPALEFVKLIEADVVPTGIAVGAHYEWWTDTDGIYNPQWSKTRWLGNTEAREITHIVGLARTKAHADLRANALAQGNGVLANVNFTELLATDNYGARRYLARHIVVATTVDASPNAPLPEGVTMVVDMHEGTSPLARPTKHHQSYESNEREGAIS